MPHKEPPHNEPHDKKPPKEKKPRRRRGFPVLLLLLLLLAAIAALLIIFKPFGSGGFGFGPGGDSGSDSQNGSAVSSVESQANVAVIRIDGNDIFLDDEKCASVDDLKSKVIAIGKDKDYELDHKTAIKSTYDEVKQMLSGLEDALDIKVSYNE